MPTLIPLITKINRMIMPSINQGTQRPCRSRPRNAPKESRPTAKSTMITAPIGVKVAHRTPNAILKKMFAYLLFVMAGYMLWRAWQYGL
jgi:hypothetical protein